MEERDDYPIIPQPENKTDGELLEEALIHIDQLNEELASLKEENAKLKEENKRFSELIDIAYAGLSNPVKFSDNK